MTATTVKFGLDYVSTGDVAAFTDAAGVKGIGQVDGLQAFKAAAAAVNRAGGVAGGRKIEIVANKRSATDSNSQVGQESCAAFTEDNRVLAADLVYQQGSPGVDCLSRRGVLSIAGGQVEAGSQHDFDRFAGRYVAPGTADTIAAARNYLDGLGRQGFLTSRSKVGLLWFDFPDFKAARSEGILPALKAHGLAITSEYQASYDGNPSSLGNVAAQMQSAALQFRSAEVDRVLSLDYQGTLEYFFMTNAQQQKYNPLYGLASWSDAEFLRANAPAQQLAGAKGIGWLPAYDIQVAQQPTDAARARCKAAMKAGNVPVNMAQSDVIITYTACAVIFYFADLLNTAKDLSPAGLASAAAALGSRPSYAGFADSYAHGKLWGTAAYRDLEYSASCACFVYSGPNRAFR